jgi:hypothetical protein
MSERIDDILHYAETEPVYDDPLQRELLSLVKGYNPRVKAFKLMGQQIGSMFVVNPHESVQPIKLGFIPKRDSIRSIRAEILS